MNNESKNEIQIPIAMVLQMETAIKQNRGFYRQGPWGSMSALKQRVEGIYRVSINGMLSLRSDIGILSKDELLELLNQLKTEAVTVSKEV